MSVSATTGSRAKLVRRPSAGAVNSREGTAPGMLTVGLALLSHWTWALPNCARAPEAHASTSATSPRPTPDAARARRGERGSGAGEEQRISARDDLGQSSHETAIFFPKRVWFSVTGPRALRDRTCLVLPVARVSHVSAERARSPNRTVAQQTARVSHGQASFLSSLHTRTLCHRGDSDCHTVTHRLYGGLQGHGDSSSKGLLSHAAVGAARPASALIALPTHICTAAYPTIA